MATRDVFLPLGITLIVLNVIAILLRFWSRILTRTIGYDDIALVVAFVMLVFFIAFVLAAIHFGLSSTTMKPWYDMGRAANYFIYGQIFYVFGVGMEKLSIGLVLLRLTSNVLMLRTTRIITIVAMSVMCATAIAIGVVVAKQAKQCRPVDDATRVQTDNCLDSKSVGTAAIVLAAIDMTVNCLFAALPVWMLRGSGLPTGVKVSILFLLGLGVVSSAVTIVRFKYIVDFQQAASVPGLAAPSIVATTLTSAIYSILEIGLGIFAAALVAIRPLARVIRDSADKYIGIDRTSALSRFYLSFRRTPPPSLESRNASRRSSQDCTETVEGTTCATSRDGDTVAEESVAKIDANCQGEGAMSEEKIDSAGGDRSCSRVECSQGSCRRSSHERG